MRAAARNLRIILSRFEAFEALTRVGLDVDRETRQAVERGRILREILRQPRFTVRTVADQVLALSAVSEGWLDAASPADAGRAVWSVAGRLRAESPDLIAALEGGGEVPAPAKERLRDLLRHSLGRGG
jgi:F-type H+-transporting ATPase subunit alpha